MDGMRWDERGHYFRSLPLFCNGGCLKDLIASIPLLIILKGIRRASQDPSKAALLESRAALLGSWDAMP